MSGAARRLVLARRAPARVAPDTRASPRHKVLRLQADRASPETLPRGSTLLPPTYDRCRLLSQLVNKVRWLASDYLRPAPGPARAGTAPARSAPIAPTTDQVSKQLPALL